MSDVTGGKERGSRGMGVGVRGSRSSPPGVIGAINAKQQKRFPRCCVTFAAHVMPLKEARAKEVGEFPK